MADLSSTAQTIVNNIVAAIAAHKAGDTYRAGEQSWAVASERTRGILTGNIVVACTVPSVLDEVEVAIKQRGHRVNHLADRGRLIVTSAT